MMDKKIIFSTGAIAFLLSARICAGFFTIPKLEITINYATLDPGCRTFFQHVFKDNYENLLQFVDYILIPYGFTEMKEEDGKTVFTCKNGPEECNGNMHQVCALKVIEYTDLKLKYCSCLMTTDGVEAYKSCATDGIDFGLIHQCVKGEDGIKYTKEYGDMTTKLNPQLSFTPALYFNGQMLSEEDIKTMSNDFIAFIKQKIDIFGDDTSPSPVPSGSPSPSP